ncbi:hypothetical protein GEMRC1_010579 [Eukaryota sp. GEM-RC1]
MVEFCDSFVKGSSPVSSLLIHGPLGCGKTAIDSVLADNKKIPFIKYLSPSELDSFSDAQKVTVIANTFLDAYKSSMSVVVLDDLEDLINYTPVGEVYSSAIVTRIRTSLQKQPPIGHQILIICTSSNELLWSRFRLSFDEWQSIPLIDSDDTVKEIMSQCSFLSDYRLCYPPKAVEGEVRSSGGQTGYVDPKVEDEMFLLLFEGYLKDLKKYSITRYIGVIFNYSNRVHV